MPHYHLHPRRQDHHHHDQNPSSQQQDPPQQGVATIISVVYQTASATFNGPVGGYTTLLPSIPTATPDPHTTATGNPFTPETAVPSDTVPHTTALSTAAPVPIPSSTSQRSSKSNFIATHSALQVESTTVLNSVQVTSTSPIIQGGPPTLQASPSSTLAAGASQVSGDGSMIVTSSSSQGLTGGAKAGIAIGVIIALVAALALLAFGYRRRKMRESEEYVREENEKNPFADTAVAPTPIAPSSAPQLSLRPVTQFQPEVAAHRNPGDTVATATGAPSTQDRDVEKAERPTNGTADSINPFDEVGTTMHQPQQGSPLSQGRPLIGSEVPAPLRIRTPNSEGSGAAVVTAVAATVAQRHNAPKPLEINRSTSPLLKPDTVAASPTLTEFSITSISSGAVAAGVAPISNVHRVQLDFKPSMEDELELRAGQLVRLLHEYDDGWVCIAHYKIISHNR